MIFSSIEQIEIDCRLDSNSSEQLLTVTDANSNVTTMTYTGTGSATIGGTKTTGNILTILVHDAGLSGGVKAINYTVLAADSLTTIASGLASAITADASLAAIGVSATSASTTITLKSNRSMSRPTRNPPVVVRQKRLRWVQTHLAI